MTTPDDIEAARPYIEAALEYAGDTHSFEDVRTMILDARLQLWPAQRSAVVTEIIEHPGKKILNFFLAGGDLRELELMAPILEAWGREQGCSSSSLVGRKGWERTFLTRSGYVPTLTVFEKDLTQP